MPELSPAQRQYIRKRTRVREMDPSEMAGELNIIPFLDIVVNLIMFLLLTSTTVLAVAQIDSELPEYRRGVGGSGAAPANTLNLNVTVVAAGVIVTGSGGKLAPGCATTATGAVMTVPMKQGDYDWEGLTACAAKVKEQFPEEEQVIVSADPLIHYRHIVAAMDALRAKGSDELFPRVLLSGGVR